MTSLSRLLAVLFCAFCYGCAGSLTKTTIEVQVETDLEDVELARRIAMQFLVSRHITRTGQVPLRVYRCDASTRANCAIMVSYSESGRGACIYSAYFIESCNGTACAYTQPDGVDPIVACE